eukprot:5531788-Amphidinium_carterae.1
MSWEEFDMIFTTIHICCRDMRLHPEARAPLPDLSLGVLADHVLSSLPFFVFQNAKWGRDLVRATQDSLTSHERGARDFTSGDAVEYFSESLQSWIPAA